VSKFPILDLKGKEAETIELPDEIFGKTINTHVLHQAVTMYQASLRQGTASTKERGSVSGGGKKPWRQKGTGRSRQGSIRSPLWHGGGVIFGPHPRDFSYSIPKKIKKAALRESLNAKYQSKDLFCVIDIKNSFNKTKEFAQTIKTLNLKGKILAMLDGSDSSIARVSRNINTFNLKRVQDVNALDILQNKTILLSKSAFKELLERIK
jgi:large subunit ribosomal protein L4